MANDYITHVTLPNKQQYWLKDETLNVFSGTCHTSGNIAIKEVSCPDSFTLTKGTVIFVTFDNTNTVPVDLLRLRVNSTTTNDAKPIKHEYNGTESNIPGVEFLRADQTYQFYYDGINWVTLMDYNSLYNYMRPYETTQPESYGSAGANPAKVADGGWRFSLSAGKYFAYTQYYDNLAESELTLNIDGTGAKPIYINGMISSSTNYILPGGQYIVYYDGTNYHFRTDYYFPGVVHDTYAAHISSTTNAIAYYTDNYGTFGTHASQDGALYATTENGTLHWGTLPIAQGGTGAQEFEANSAIISGNSATAALTTRSILNNIAPTSITANDHLITANTLYNYIGNQNLSHVGTVVDGTWNASIISTSYGGTGNMAFNANTLIYANSTTQLSSATNIYATTSAIAINSTAAPTEGNLQVKGSSVLQDVLPELNDSYNLGRDSTRWANIYLSTALRVGAQSTTTNYNSDTQGSFVGPGLFSSMIMSTTSNGYYLYGNEHEYGYFSIDTLGTSSTLGIAELSVGNSFEQNQSYNSMGRVKIYHTNSAYSNYTADSWTSNGTIETFTMIGATSNTANADSWTTLILGNNQSKAIANNSHSQGRIQIYSDSATYTEIRSQDTTQNHIFYLPQYNDDMYATHVSSTAAVGGPTQPVYVEANGHIVSTTATVGDSYTPAYLNAGISTITYPTQEQSFKFEEGDASITLTSSAYCPSINNVYVLQIVVNGGTANLIEPIQWQAKATPGDNTTGDIILSTSAVLGDVTGYILTARGRTAPDSNT